jgi:hypothetical protein
MHYLGCLVIVQIVRSKALVVTSPSLVTAEVLGNKEHGVLPQAAELARINCPPVASVTVAYPNSAFKVRLRFPVVCSETFPSLTSCTGVCQSGTG